MAAVEFSSLALLHAAKPKSGMSPRRRLAAIHYFALCLLLVSLARPQVEKGLSDFESKGINLMLALDWSSSMMKKDFIIDHKRATRADALVKVISEFMRTRPADRIGLVRFDANAFLLSPLTLDHDWLIVQLKGERNGRGTAPGSAMVIAAEHLLPATNQTKVVIVVTDADQVNNGPRPEEAARALASLGIKVHVIQIVDFKDMAGYNMSGNEMARVPELTGGQFFQVADFVGLRGVYNQIDRLEKAVFKEDRQRNYRELMAWFAIPALLLLLLEQVLRNTLWRTLP
jgi:Ca-activated chloride channel family protein